MRTLRITGGKPLDGLGDHTGHDLHHVGGGVFEHFMDTAETLGIQSKKPLHRQKSLLLGGTDDLPSCGDDTVYTETCQILQTFLVFADAFGKVDVDKQQFVVLMCLLHSLPDAGKLGIEIKEHIGRGFQRGGKFAVTDGGDDRKTFQPVHQFMQFHSDTPP